MICTAVAELGAFWDSLGQQLTPTLAGGDRAVVAVPENNDNDALSILHALQATRHTNVALEVKSFELYEFWIHSDHEPYLPAPSVCSHIKFGAYAFALTKSGKNLVVAPSDGSNISIVSFDGTVIRTFAGERTHYRKTVHVDSKGLIWTCQYRSQKISCYTEKGELVHQIDVRYWPTTDGLH